MRFLSLCSGIEAASVAWSPLGWTAVAFAEIEPFPCAVLAHYWPGVPNLGDVTAITDERVAELGRIDVVVGGTPCQDLSVAGQRKGLAGSRSMLFHDFTRIFDAARRLCGARWCVWENVPGTFSTHGGRDFAVVVGSLVGCGFDAPRDGWRSAGAAVGPRGLLEWRVLDAQFFGLAQRRKRVFAVLDTGDWQRRAPVLLEPEGVCRDSAPSREAGARAAGTLTASALDGSSACAGDGRAELMVAHTLRAEGFDASEDGTGRGTPLVAGPLLSSSDGAGWRSGAEEAAMNHLVADPITRSEGRTYSHEGANNFRLHNVVAAPLTHGGHNPTSRPPGRRKEDDENVVACFDETQITHRENRSTAAPHTAALASSARPPSIALRADSVRSGEAQTPSPDAEGRVRLRDAGFNVCEEFTPTLDASATHFVLPAPAIAIGEPGRRTGRSTDNARHGIGIGEPDGPMFTLGAERPHGVSTGMAVRRLTPRECERLQGFPDDFTLIAYRGKPASDSVRYAALGNSMAVPVIRWIGQRIMRANVVEQREEQVA